MPGYGRWMTVLPAAPPTIFDHVTLEELRSRTSEKWARYGPDVLPLWVAEMDVPQAEPVVEAVTSALRRGDTGYPWGDAYADAFAGFAADRWGWQVDVAATAVVTDVMRGMTEVLRAVTRPGDVVVVSTPVYTPFYEIVRHTGRVVRTAGLTADLRLDLGALDEAFRGASAYLLCNPHNPTGTVHTADELAAVAELARRHGVRIVSDEIHAALTSPAAERAAGRPLFVPMLSVPGADDAVALVSASKAWNLAGLKAALAVGGARSGAEVRAIPEVAHGASHLGVIAHATAFTHARGWLDEVRDGVDVTRQHLTARLAERVPGAVVYPAEATYLAWVDFRGVRDAQGRPLGDDPARELLTRGRVAFTAGLPFGAGGEGHVRINLATSRAVLDEAVDRVAAALES